MAAKTTAVTGTRRPSTLTSARGSARETTDRTVTMTVCFVRVPRRGAGVVAGRSLRSRCVDGMLPGRSRRSRVPPPAGPLLSAYGAGVGGSGVPAPLSPPQMPSSAPTPIAHSRQASRTGQPRQICQCPLQLSHGRSGGADREEQLRVVGGAGRVAPPVVLCCIHAVVLGRGEVAVLEGDQLLGPAVRRAFAGAISGA